MNRIAPNSSTVENIRNFLNKQYYSDEVLIIINGKTYNIASICSVTTRDGVKILIEGAE